MNFKKILTIQIKILTIHKNPDRNNKKLNFFMSVLFKNIQKQMKSEFYITILRHFLSNQFKHWV